jgi:SAM-dependent methyltransferase
VIARYRSARRGDRNFVAAKLALDPVVRQVAARLPLPSPILDIGCGRGQLSLMIKLAQPEAEVRGWDFDARKVALARGAATLTPALPGLSFEAGDAAQAELPAAGTVLLIDLLHYLPIPAQDRLLERCAAALLPGGVLLVRDLDAVGGWRTRATRVQEWIGRRIGLNRAGAFHFRPAAEIVARLELAGLSVRVEESRGRLPLGNVLIEAWRGSGPGAGV